MEYVLRALTPPEKKLQHNPGKHKKTKPSFSVTINSEPKGFQPQDCVRSILMIAFMFYSASCSVQIVEYKKFK